VFDVSLTWPATVCNMQRPLALRTVLTLALVGWSAHAASQAGSTLGISVIPSPHQPSQSKRLGLAELIKREAEQHGLPPNSQTPSSRQSAGTKQQQVGALVRSD